MAGSSLLALLDDIATVLDDVAVMSKVAAKKTAGVLGDDLALNAEQVSGVRASRELPVVWAVFKGSMLNKLILVPSALLISAFIPWLITPLLMVGGAYLCFEGFEKIYHKIFHAKDEEELEAEVKQAIRDPKTDMVKFEQKKIKGAIRTDFILSAEIIVIALGTVQEAAFTTQVGVVVTIALLMTFGVYGLVAGIVKLDDAGLYLEKSEGDSLWSRFKRTFGSGLLAFAPILMKFLAIAGTAAMFLVGGGILVHGIPLLAEYLHAFEHLAHSIDWATGVFEVLLAMIFNAVVGIMAGGLVVACVSGIKKVIPAKT